MSKEYHTYGKIRVVYNRNYGGFNLFPKAASRIVELGWNKFRYPKHVTKENEHYWVSSDIDRHDPMLLRVVDEMGIDNVGEDLAVEEIEVGYYIDCYDGKETVISN